ncbi:PREDICTED: uncharacterized protein LOC105557251 [Vollenhovia emeryi]|uniref:uncharacterized protein LOC105557251 n=1 Tax=Vollenhovia emeryi TaxID=411798 RepID=UPI0005F4B6A7|nr:PREDICTED: uncharacterized protein LOC105557251 [Vollenhovia emeryi]
MPAGSTLICYADDTLVLAGGGGWREATDNANIAVACAVRAIASLGMKMSAGKTEAIFVHDGTKGEPPDMYISVDGMRVKVGKLIKYLGLHIDGRWSFKDHLTGLGPRLDAAANTLSRVMLNLGGPNGRVRRLYGNITNSIALYGAPIWADALIKEKAAAAALRKTKRRMAIRAIRGYRTVSRAAATLMAGIPPIEFVAKAHAAMYERVAELKRAGMPAHDRVKRAIALQLKWDTRKEWRCWLERPDVRVNGQ